MKPNFKGIGMTSERTRERLIQRLRARGIVDERVLTVMRQVPRHIFVDEALAHRAYEDNALPIGFQQTISQPYIVARMTEGLLGGANQGKSKLERVLEIGTGSGYQTAVLSPLATEVYSVERIRKLYAVARERMKLLALYNVTLKYTDGTEGWDDKGPYDGIIVTAAPGYVPENLKDQLAIGGRLIIPVGEKHQKLMVIERMASGFQETALDDVRFVPLQPGTAGE